MANRIVLLGTGTCQLQTHRNASSVLVELNDLRLIYDFGRGIAARTAEIGFQQDDLEHIVLSHFHPDHLSDLIPYLQAACWSQTDPRRKDLHIYGPIGLEVQLMRFLSLFGPDTLVRREYFQVHLHEVRVDQLEIADHTFDFIELPPADNRGLKFHHGGHTYALTGDSDFHDQEVEFLRGVDLAIIDSGHPTDEDILELAVATQVPRIVCSHLYRELNEDIMNQRARAAGYEGQLIVGRDLMTFEM